MPIHDFIHEESSETLTVYVAASAPAAEHQQQTRDGKVYKRIYSVPLMATNMGTRHGDATEADFRRATTDKKGLKMGDMQEISAEMSAKRAQRNGLDPVQEAYYERYAQENGGEKHTNVVKREKLAKANAKLGEWGIKVNIP